MLSAALKNYLFFPFLDLALNLNRDLSWIKSKIKSKDYVQVILFPTCHSEEC